MIRTPGSEAPSHRVGVTVHRRSTPDIAVDREVLARGVFLDYSAAHEFVAHQMRALRSCGFDDVVVHLVTVDPDGSERPTRTIIGSIDSVLADLDTAGQASYAIASVLTRIVRSPAQVDLAEVLQHACATAAADTGGIDRLLENTPPTRSAAHVTALVHLGNATRSPLAMRTEPVVLHLDTSDQQLTDYGIRTLYERDMDTIRRELETSRRGVIVELRPIASSAEKQSMLLAELGAVDALYRADTAAYLHAWIDAATEYLRKAGLPPSVPVTLSIGLLASVDDAPLHAASDHAFTVTPIPGIDCLPADFPYRDPDGGIDTRALIDAERAGGHSYRNRAAASRARARDGDTHLPGVGRAPLDSITHPSLLPRRPEPTTSHNPAPHSSVTDRSEWP